MEQCDAIVIGCGQAGTPLSIAVAESGRKAVLIESRHVGGPCVNVGESRGRKTREYKTPAVARSVESFAYRESLPTLRKCDPLGRPGAATDSDNDVRFLAPNAKDFRIDKIPA